MLQMFIIESFQTATIGQIWNLNIQVMPLMSLYSISAKTRFQMTNFKCEEVKNVNFLD